eukprot:TRINITY_DN167_c0_g1_i1.p1 TRINITY_DN167_c0_g1~~TRINITY_DN167_c0_g1_i1.p1  ORF type:complete len:337 (-),score=60.37 TRINITY_DN167_c0_g1_i1:169-1179(-)
MTKVIKVYRDIPCLDVILTAIFFGNLIFIPYVFSTSNDLVKIICCLFGAAAAIRICNFVSCKFGKWFSKTCLSKQGDPLADNVTMEKFTAQMWQLFIHVSMGITELYVLWDETWWHDTRTIWIPHPSQQVAKDSVKYLYFLQLGIWVYTAFSHRFLEPRRKDYFVMYVHHIVTIGLVAASALYGYYRIGVLVLVVHDISDIPIDLMKLFYMTNLNERRGFFLSEIAFVTNLCTWVSMRMWYFPYKIIWNGLFESHELLASVHPGKPWLNWFPEEIPAYLFCLVLLISLFCLHVWWFALMLRMVAGLFEKRGADEIVDTIYEGDGLRKELEANFKEE